MMQQDEEALKEWEDRWKLVEDKSKSILEILENISFYDIKIVLDKVNEKITHINNITKYIKNE